jgi:glycerol-3-phosphate O-acyltransferase/dihydroxyacetone phosphate acyltransferase
VLYESVKPVVNIALTWYYRSVSVAGRSRVPTRGPVLLAVNHPNALVDALVVACAMPRRVHFTAKATIFSNPAASAFLHRAGVIPLRRAADEASERNVTRPIGTAADASRNADAFRAVSDALADGSAVVIFPEGRSHDEPHLAPIRTGLARMALQARETRSVHGIVIVPVGLLFERKEEPRSRVLVQVGEPIQLDAFVATLSDASHAVERLTALVAERLSDVTINFASSDDASRIATVSETLAALLEPPGSVGDHGAPLSSVLAIVRRAERVRLALAREQGKGGAHVLKHGVANPQDAEGASIKATTARDEPLQVRVVEFERRMLAFRARLATERITVADVAIESSASPGLRFAFREGAIAAVLLPVSWWGRITHFIPIRIARWLALRHAQARDEPAMNTLLFGVLLVLVSYVVETAAVWHLFGAWWALAFLVTLVPSASSDLRYGDRARRRSARARTYLKFRRTAGLQRELLSEADWIRHEAGAIEQLAQR